MITHDILMKHFGSKLISGHQTYLRKMKKAELGANASQTSQHFIHNRGVNLSSLLNVSGKVRGVYEEGPDGESYIKILFGYKYNGGRPLTVIAQLASYSHRSIFFKRFDWGNREQSSIIYNMFLPSDYLIEYKKYNYVLGKKLVPARFNETSTLQFNSKDQFVYGLNVTPAAQSKDIQERYKTMVASESKEIISKAKLLGNTKIYMLKQRAKGLMTDIRPKYIQMLNEIVQGRGTINDVVNLLIMLNYWKLDHKNIGTNFKQMMKAEEPYGTSLLENR